MKYRISNTLSKHGLWNPQKLRTLVLHWIVGLKPLNQGDFLTIPVVRIIIRHYNKFVKVSYYYMSIGNHA